jgi:hypothetical protein
MGEVSPFGAEVDPGRPALSKRGTSEVELLIRIVATYRRVYN